MAKKYEWMPTVDITPPSTLSHGVIDAPSGWQEAEAGVAQSHTYEYYYRDSNLVDQHGESHDTDSTRVLINATDSWTATVDNNNVLTIVITTTINSIVRDDKRGNDQNLPGRDISIYRKENEPAVWSYQDLQIATNHSILSSALTLPQETIVIPPGDTADIRSSFFLHNETIGYSYYDDIKAGVQFKNPLPPEYIPGKVYNGSNDWLSHNRDTNGHAKLYTGSAWGDDMKTVDGGTESGDPPEIWHSSSSKKNMRKIGVNS